MRAGALRDRITIQAKAGGTADGRGGSTGGTWDALTDASRIPARVEPLSGEEQLAAMQAQSAVTYEVSCRYRSGVKADMRVLWHLGDGDRTLYIVGAPIITGNRQGLLFRAREDAD